MHLCKSSSLFSDPHFPYVLHVNCAMLPHRILTKYSNCMISVALDDYSRRFLNNSDGDKANLPTVGPFSINDLYGNAALTFAQ